MTYMNPILQFMGYKAYDARIKSESTNDDFSCIIISNRENRIKIGDEMLASGNGDFVFADIIYQL